jgi:hypothetical protein
MQGHSGCMDCLQYVAEPLYRRASPEKILLQRAWEWVVYLEGGSLQSRTHCWWGRIERRLLMQHV